MVHQRQPRGGAGAGGAAADHAGVHIGGGAGAVEVIPHLLHRAHEVQERQRPHVAQGVVGKAALRLNRLDDGAGAARQIRLLIQGQMKAQLGGVHQSVEPAAVSHAVGDVAQRRHMDGGAVGVDVAGQAAAGDRFHHAVVDLGLDVHQPRRRFHHKALPALFLGHQPAFQHRRGGADGVGAGVNRIAHHFHDDVADAGVRVGRRHDQIHRHFRNAVGLLQ